jgi:hypothetical protein
MAKGAHTYGQRRAYVWPSERIRMAKGVRAYVWPRERIQGARQHKPHTLNAKPKQGAPQSRARKGTGHLPRPGFLFYFSENLFFRKISHFPPQLSLRGLSERAFEVEY